MSPVAWPTGVRGKKEKYRASRKRLSLHSRYVSPEVEWATTSPAVRLHWT
jgi:hypothetical protein